MTNMEHPRLKLVHEAIRKTSKLSEILNGVACKRKKSAGSVNRHSVTL
jgi:hypothetical protein